MSKNVLKCPGEAGNTKQPPAKRISTSKYWCFTWNNYPEDGMSNCLIEFKNCKYIVGREVGEQGTPHLQGYVECSKLIRPLEFFSLPKGIHWEKRKGSREQNIAYCSKEGNYETNMVIKTEVSPYQGEDLPKKLFPWQEEVISLCKSKPNDRDIWWIGGGYNCGKSKLCKYLCYWHNACLLAGCSRDALFSVSGKEKIICINVPKHGKIDYTLLEQLKDGMFYSTKYEGKMILMEPPHIFVFTNILKDEVPITAIDKNRLKVIRPSGEGTYPSLTA